MAGLKYGMDLGTSSIKLVCTDNGSIVNEKNVIALKDGKDLYESGDFAYEMYERTPENIEIVFPVRNGVIADIKSMEQLFDIMYRKLNGGKIVNGSTFCIAVPTDITEVEKRAFYNIVSMSRIKAKEVSVVEKPIADAVGVGIDIESPKGNLVVNIGSDTTEISVISMGGIVLTKIIKTAGKKFDEVIINTVRKKYNLFIGSKTAEQIKIQIADALGDQPEAETQKMFAYGRNVVSGLPVKVEVDSKVINEGIQECLHTIIDSVKMLLEKTPPELSADIIHSGMFLTGGSANIKNIDKLIKKETGLDVNIPDNPELSIISGINTIYSDSKYDKVRYFPKEKEYK